MKIDPNTGTRIFDPNPRRAYYVGTIYPQDYGYYHWGGNAGGDVCNGVFPTGVWRMPTIKELKDTFIWDGLTAEYLLLFDSCQYS